MDSELGAEGRSLIYSESKTENGRDGGSNNAARPSSISELFEKACPAYIAMGMTYDEYWRGDPWAVRAYREAYRMNQKNRMTEANLSAWMNGLYAYEALCAVSPILRALSKARKPSPYVEKPHDLFGDEMDEQAPQLTKEEKERKKSDMAFNAYMTAWMSAVNKKFEGKEGNDHGDDGIR